MDWVEVVSKVRAVMSTGQSDAQWATTNYIPIMAKQDHLAYVDGGNAPLLKGATMQVELIRAVALQLRPTKIITKIEFIAIINSTSSGFALQCIPDVLHPDPLELKAENLDDAAAIVRQLAEWQVAEIASKTQPLAVIMDGQLIAEDADVSKRIVNLKFPTVGLSKTTQRDDEGSDIGRALLSHGPQIAWWASAPDNSIWARLHSSTKRVFRLEFGQIDASLQQKCLDALAKDATDPVFLGYPYGLIEADRRARITQEQQRMLRLRLCRQLGEDAELVESMRDAHNVLDKIKW